MKQGKILYDPLPIARMGVRKEDQEVIIANDYSCFAQMIEEYISYGAIKIVIPQSAPEVKTLEEMPILLKNRISIIDDTVERETVHRLLFKLRKEFNVKIDEDYIFLKHPKSTERILIDSIDQVHEDLKKIALGYNHKIQASINTEIAIKNFRFLRTKVVDSDSRLVLAELEAILNQYKKIEFEAITPPKEDTPSELISLFDKLINDRNYLEYSDSINQLTIPQGRDKMIIRLRELSRLIRTKNYIAEGWDYVSKILEVWTGVPLPESKAISSLFNGKELPSFVNMDAAKIRAAEMWRSSNSTKIPLRRDGLPIANDDIIWLPPLASMQIKTSNRKHFSLGTLGELRKMLQSVETEIEK